MPVRDRFFYRILCVILSVFLCLWMVSCAGCLLPVAPVDEPSSLSLLTWNTQLFFDAVEDGSEFEEYRGSSSRWSRELYEKRLARLCEVLLLAGVACGGGRQSVPDIVVLQEIENAGVLRDICSRLPFGAGFAEAVFVPPPAGSAFGNALLSRYPVLSVRSHSVIAPVSVRPTLEVRLKIADTETVVFALHWKSRLESGVEGMDATAIRQLQEQQLYSRVGELRQSEPGTLVLAAGDCNMNWEESQSSPFLTDCWPEYLARLSDGMEQGPSGSYYYDGKWETIDRVFLSSDPGGRTGYRNARFTVLSEAPLTGSSGLPARFELYSGAGYSDHLPLLLQMQRID